VAKRQKSVKQGAANLSISPFDLHYLQDGLSEERLEFLGNRLSGDGKDS
jgi:hypothetical protein